VVQNIGSYVGGMGQDATCKIIHMSHIQWTMWVVVVVVVSSHSYYQESCGDEATCRLERIVLLGGEITKHFKKMWMISHLWP
jgi:hypothetical protein